MQTKHWSVCKNHWKNIFADVPKRKPNGKAARLGSNQKFIIWRWSEIFLRKSNNHNQDAFGFKKLTKNIFQWNILGPVEQQCQEHQVFLNHDRNNLLVFYFQWLCDSTGQKNDSVPGHYKRNGENNYSFGEKGLSSLFILRFLL